MLTEKREVQSLPANFYKEYCIPCDGLKTSWMQQEPHEITVPVYPEGHTLAGQKRIGEFGSNNSTISFINEEGLLFIFPYRKKALDTLKEAGYHQDYLYVSLSNQEEIVDNDLLSNRYKHLRVLARAE